MRGFPSLEAKLTPLWADANLASLGGTIFQLLKYSTRLPRPVSPGSGALIGKIAADMGTPNGRMAASNT